MGYKEDRRYMGHEQRIAEGFMEPGKKKKKKDKVSIRNIRSGRIIVDISPREGASMVKTGRYEYIKVSK